MGKRLKIGDVFEILFKDNGTKGYVQYIANDSHQLNSDVIRAFKKRYSLEFSPTLNEIVADGVDFYAHVVDVKEGEKDGSWRKIGNSDDVGDLTKPLFRSSLDAGMSIHSPSHISNDWAIWRLCDEDSVFVKGNHPLLRESHIGRIVWPISIIEQMKTGKYPGFYPLYE